jgi:hypothetical protein
LHGKDIRYVHEWKQWIIWGKHHWEIDYDGAAIRLAKETVQAMYIEATKIADHEKSRALIKHGLKSQAEPRLLAMVSLAKSDLEVVLSAKKLDSNPWLLGVPNGVIELKTGDFRTGRREDYITKQAGVPYDAEAKCPEWLKFLDTITGGNGELQLYLQRASARVKRRAVAASWKSASVTAQAQCRATDAIDLDGRVVWLGGKQRGTWRSISPSCGPRWASAVDSDSGDSGPIWGACCRVRDPEAATTAQTSAGEPRARRHGEISW